MSNQVKDQIFIQNQYDKLLEEKIAFEQAGMTKKVIEWNHKIKLFEIELKYEKITFENISKSLGIEGLNKSLEETNKKFLTDRASAEDIVDDIFLREKIRSYISESKVYELMDSVKRFKKDNNYIDIVLLNRCLSKIKGTFAITVREMIRALEKNVINSSLEAKIIIEPIEQYKQNDNPPMEVLNKLITAKYSSLFSCFAVAYPIIDKKAPDPIIVGIVLKENQIWQKQILNIRDVKLNWFGNYDMYKIGEWL